MADERELPAALKVVAWLFVLEGVYALLDTLVSPFSDDGLNINLGMIGVFVGLGLLELRPGWRTCALVFLWIGISLSLVVALVVLCCACPEVTVAWKVFYLALAAGGFGLSVWQYHVLTRADVRRLFGVGEARQVDGMRAGAEKE